MRTRTAMLLAVASICLLTAQATVSSEELLQRGRDHFRAGKFAEAAKELREASDALLTPEQMKAYVNNGQAPPLAQFETALVYLTLADVQLKRDADAREALQRLSAAEGIAPTFAALPLSAEVAAFPQIAKQMMPALKLSANPSIANSAPQPAPVAATEHAPSAAPATATATAQTTAQTTAPPPAAPVTVSASPATQEAVSEAQQRYIDQKIAEARVEIERRAQERIEAIQKSADEQIAAARAAAEREAQQKIAAAQTAVPNVQNAAGVVSALHKAAVQANTGEVQLANDVYLRLATAAGASRDVIAAAAVGLYRTGDFVDALQAFQKLGTLARGEEDLRYYKAVSLFETGHYADARKELDCALPYIELNDDVARYQAKIDQMLATQRSAGSSS